MDRATSGMIFYITASLLIAVLVYCFWNVRKYHGDTFPLNRRLFMRYDERYPKKVESGEVLFIAGKLSRTIQFVLYLMMIMGAMAFVYFLIKYPIPTRFQLSDRTFNLLFSLSLVYGIMPEVFLAIKALKLIDKKHIHYFPPPPEKTPWFDYKGFAITATKIEHWRRLKRRAIPAVLFSWLFLFITTEYVA